MAKLTSKVKHPKERAHAIVTMFGASRWTPAGRKEIARWLRRQAAFLEAEGEGLSTGRFTARYFSGKAPAKTTAP